MSSHFLAIAIISCQKYKMCCTQCLARDHRCVGVFPEMFEALHPLLLTHHNHLADIDHLREKQCLSCSEDLAKLSLYKMYDPDDCRGKLVAHNLECWSASTGKPEQCSNSDVHAGPPGLQILILCCSRFSHIYVCTRFPEFVLPR